jgi:F0F1-type ATP synthase assembly protein I
MTPSHPARRGDPPDAAGRRATGKGRSPGVWRDVDQSSAVIAEITAGPVVWGGIGWVADAWLGTDPWLLVIGVMTGFAAGLYLVWLRTARTAGARPAAGPSDDDPTKG